MPHWPFEDARSTVLSHAKPLGNVKEPLESALGLCLAEPLFARVDSPAFDNSAVDGFAVRSEEVAAGTVLPVQATVSAGSVAPSLSPGHAIAILTGAPMPPGANAAVMQEDTERVGDQVRFLCSPKVDDFVRRRGEEYAAGDRLLGPGTRITPPVIGVLAANGLTQATVYRPPVVRVVSTGNELVAPGSERGPSEIFDGNGPALLAAVEGLGVREVRLSRARDRKEALLLELGEALDQADVVITSGGVSVGAKDLIKDVWKELGVEQVVWQVAMRPGKPFYFGVGRGKLVLGLPGNPVSALVCFHLFCRPALQMMMGFGEEQIQPVVAKLTKEVRPQPDRTDFQRGILTEGEHCFLAEPLTNQGSHMLGALAAANCLICIPPGENPLTEGSDVETYPLGWWPSARP